MLDLACGLTPPMGFGPQNAPVPLLWSREPESLAPLSYIVNIDSSFLWCLLDCLSLGLYVKVCWLKIDFSH